MDVGLSQPGVTIRVGGVHTRGYFMIESGLELAYVSLAIAQTHFQEILQWSP